MAIKGGNLKAAGGGGPAIQARFVIEGLDKTSAEFKQARKEINGKLRDGLQKAGEREALPHIKVAFVRKEPATKRGLGVGAMANSLYVKRDRTTVAIASRLRGKQNRALGWINFGGKRANDSRTREGREVIVTTLQRRRPEIDSAILGELMRAFNGLDHTP